MVKKVKQSGTNEVNETQEVSPEQSQEESLTIQQKKANAAKLKKVIKKHHAKIKASLDLKQVIKATDALKEYQKKIKEKTSHKKLLQEEDDFIHLTFTLTEIPSNHTPRPF